MKKRLIAILILLTILLFPLSGFGATLKSSGELVESQSVSNAPCILGGILILTDGTNDATVIVYDNAKAASGTKIWESVVVGTDNYGGGLFPHILKCDNGIYVTISGTGASCIIFWSYGY